MRAWWGNLRQLMVLGFLLKLLTGCEGVTTGTEVVRLPLQPAQGGGYVPVKLPLDTGMNPLSINFRADFTLIPGEVGGYNTYRAQLSKDGNVVATKTFNINNPRASNSQGDGGDDAPPPNSAIQTLFLTDIQASGEYELAITALRREFTLKEPSVDVRRNVQRPPQ